MLYTTKAHVHTKPNVQFFHIRGNSCEVRGATVTDTIQKQIGGSNRDLHAFWVSYDATFA